MYTTRSQVFKIFTKGFAFRDLNFFLLLHFSFSLNFDYDFPRLPLNGEVILNVIHLQGFTVAPDNQPGLAVLGHQVGRYVASHVDIPAHVEAVNESVHEALKCQPLFGRIFYAA